MGQFLKLYGQLREGGDAPEPCCAAPLPGASVPTGRRGLQWDKGQQSRAALGALVLQDYLQLGWQVNGIARCHLHLG